MRTAIRSWWDQARARRDFLADSTRDSHPRIRA